MNNISRIDLYLQRNMPGAYVNTPEEHELVSKFVTLYTLSKAAHELRDEGKPGNIEMWRKAYYGKLNALKKDSTEESSKKSRSLRKMCYELIESKIDNSIPMPKIQPRYKSDLPLVDITENYLKFEADRILTKSINDKSERATYIDGTSWYKVWWDSLDNTYERSGSVKIGMCLSNQIIPQAGVSDYRELEYIFEIRKLSVSNIYDLYNRLITSVDTDTNMVEVITCYYLNKDRIVGQFMWASHSSQVICNEESWQIRKLRTCAKCGHIQPRGEKCSACGHTNFSYKNAEKEILDEDLMEIYNPYDIGEEDDEQRKDEYKERLFLSAGSEIPFYQIRQLPFVPRPAISTLDSIYGTSEVGIILEAQDATNKTLTKCLEKTLASGAVITKPKRVKLDDTDKTFKIMDVNSAEEAGMVQTKQIMADTTQDIVAAELFYSSARSTSGVTDSYQGKSDSTAVSGKAKQIQAVQTAGRIESLRIMKSTAFAGLYELLLKYMLAFSDEPRRFLKTLPDGGEQEMVWNKYMFLDKDKYGTIYYRDDFSFNSDPAATLSQNRVQMWQETTEKFIQGGFGNPEDPRTLTLYWNILYSLQYPLAKVALAGIKDNSQHIPADVEQALMQHPELIKDAMATIEEQESSGSGGARPNSGPDGNGATHAANVERTNSRNRASVKDAVVSAQQQ